MKRGTSLARSFFGTILLVSLMAPAPAVIAQTTDDTIVEQFIEVPPPPPAPSVSERDDEEAAAEEGLEPEVTIVQRRDATYEEYRMNGRLFMVKVVPTIGKPYFYVDRDGDGLMETRMNDRSEEIKVPQWVIFSW